MQNNKILVGILATVLASVLTILLERYINTIYTQKIVLESEKLDTPHGTSAYLLTSVRSDSALNLEEFRILPFSHEPIRQAIFKYNHYNKHVDLMVNQKITPYTYKISRDFLKKEFEENNFSFEFLGGDSFKFGFVFDGEENQPQFKCEVVTGQLQNIPCEVEEKVSQPPKIPFWGSRDSLKDGSLGPEMVEIPPGKFTMGAGAEADEKPVHPVEVKSFAMCRYEITFEQY
ncbi:MAG: SUMF1/EgtB/PvdO family nonheme iron enzyme, partial [Pseudomonadota bacterium]